MKKALFYFLVFEIFIQVTALSARGQAIPTNRQNLPSKQIMVVLTDNWDDLHGRLYAFKKQNSKWVLQFSNAVVVGSKGLGLGDGVIPLTSNGVPIKHEGDKKSPAGIFGIGTAFGYARARDTRWIKNPYIRAFDTLICVDDIHSTAYNILISKDTGKNDYHSFEYMHRKDNYYKWGLFINHNSGTVVPGDGSCIFLHIWENADSGTVGCTAMTEKNVLRILHWINAKNKPLLVQLPVDEYRKLQTGFNLPDIKYH